MGLKPKFNNDQVKALMRIKLKQVETIILNRLILIGETFVKNARENGSYNDITGNLRSSIGYIILKDGSKVKDNFAQSAKGSDKSTGVKKAKQLLAELKVNYSVGYVLVVVAGMQYAAAVESKGKDVLTASSIIAKNDLKAAIDSIRDKLKKQ
jgi:hypothetical protein